MLKKVFNRIFKTDKQSDDAILAKSNDMRTNQDGKISFDDMVLKMFIHNEAKYRYQAFEIRRSTENNRITLGEVIQLFFPKNTQEFTSLAVIHRQDIGEKTIEEKLITDKEQIQHFDLFSCILRRKVDGHYTWGTSNEITLIASTETENYILTLVSLSGNDAYKYMRVSLLLPDNSANDDCRTMHSPNLPTAISFVLSNCENENDNSLEEYEKIEQSYQYKQQNDVELNDLEEEFIRGVRESMAFENVRYGDWLYEQRRYYDAYVMYERGVKYMLPFVDTKDSQTTIVYSHICENMGHCLSKLDREVEAVCYYDLARSIGEDADMHKSIEYAKSLARLGNTNAFKEVLSLQGVAVRSGDVKSLNELVRTHGIDVLALLKQYHQQFESKITLTPTFQEKVTLGQVLFTFFGMQKKNILPCVSIYDAKTHTFIQQLEDSAEACDIILSEPEAQDKVYVMSCSHASYQIDQEGEDKSKLAWSTPLVIAVHSIQSKEYGMRVRIDGMRSNFPNDDDKRIVERVNRPLCCSFTLAMDNSSQTFSAMDASLIPAIQYAWDLKDQNRYFESYRLALWIFELAQHRLKGDNAANIDEPQDSELEYIRIDAAFLTGFCLMEMLPNPCAAAYYLEIATKANRVDYIEEYVNFLSNTNDPRALSYIENMSKWIQKPDNPEAIADWNHLMAFFKRRKAYILIEKKRYDEAKTILTEMLDDPDNRQFAQGELNYIQRQENHQ